MTTQELHDAYEAHLRGQDEMYGSHRAIQHFYAHLHRGYIRRVRFAVIDGKELTPIIYYSHRGYNTSHVTPYLSVVQVRQVPQITVKLIEHGVPSIREMWTLGDTDDQLAVCHASLWTADGKHIPEISRKDYRDVANAIQLSLEANSLTSVKL